MMLEYPNSKSIIYARKNQNNITERYSSYLYEIPSHVYDRKCDKMDIDKYYQEWLTSSGFKECPPSPDFCSAGKLYQTPQEYGNGYYWVYGEKDLYDIKIHDFYFYKDSFISLEMPECLSITYYDSVSGEEFTPYRRLTTGCVKSFYGGHETYKAMMHKNIPIRSIGIEVLPAYYENYLRKTYPDDYMPPHEAFRNIGQTLNFPEMSHLLRQVWEYRGEGIPAKLFYEAKVAEAISLVYEHGKQDRNNACVRMSKQDIDALNNVASYINDHFNTELPLSTLAKIACMGTTKLKSSFKQTYHCTISEYIQQRRMSHAEMLLTSTDLAIKQVASAVGYSNAGRFAATFKNNTGLFPAEYRKMTRRK